MTGYIVRRLLMGIIVLIMVSLAVFFLMRLFPGDPIMLYLSGSLNIDTMPPEKLAELRAQFHLDKPVFQQYLIWISGIFQGDFGTSIYYRENVAVLMLERYPITIILGGIGFVLSFTVGMTVGILAAIRRGTWIDSTVTVIAYLFQAIPQFWLGILIILVFSLRLDLFPSSGYTPPWVDFGDFASKMVMPVMCYAVFGLAATARQMRSAVIEVIRQDYVRTAWSKGLKERTVISKHVLKNSLIPVITMAGMFVPMIFGGSVFVESVFAIPGMGRLLVTSIQGQDYVVVQSVTFILAAVVVVVNMLVEISYVFFDPRIRYG
ncbi:MAG: ABC transporter permease [Dehalococcoidales bacterium]|nr:ABC transporter permease [Dehalococcoidales bacterium]